MAPVLPDRSRCPVPDESTIRKLTRRLGPDVVDELNVVLLGLAAEQGHLRLERVRVDTTVVEADIRYLTDSGLLTKAVSRIAVLMRRIEATGMTVTYTDRTLEARHHAHEIGVWLRRRNDEAKAEVFAITGLLADLAEQSLAEADRIFASKRQSRRAARRRIDEFRVLAERTRRLITQARTRINGDIPLGATRLVSLHEPDARPIAKGRLGRPVEFGYKAQVCDNDDGLIVDDSVHVGNPPAARVATERGDTFVAAVKWRTGAEGRISCLKRDLGWRRTRLRSHDGARIWCGHGVFAHNLTKLNQLRQ